LKARPSWAQKRRGKERRVSKITLLGEGQFDGKIFNSATAVRKITEAGAQS